jgi:hypothetical protein
MKIDKTMNNLIFKGKRFNKIIILSKKNFCHKKRFNFCHTILIFFGKIFFVQFRNFVGIKTEKKKKKN